MRLTKIYTKVGDKGTTLLATGQKISKSDQRIESYGTVDELNAAVGAFRDECLNVPALTAIAKQLLNIQHELFDLGGELSIPDLKAISFPIGLVNDLHIKRLEGEIDLFNVDLPPLENFVLPGGVRANSLAHLARTICRRAEREVVRLAAEATIRPEAIIYLNRLSDWFFVASRYVSHVLKCPETLWTQESKR